MVTRSHEVIAGVRDLLSVVKDAETGQRGYLLTGDEAYLEPYEDGLRRFKPVAARLDDLTAGNRDEHARFIALRASADAKIAELKRTVALIEVRRSHGGPRRRTDGQRQSAHGRRSQERGGHQGDRRQASRAAHADMRQGVSTTIGSLAITAVAGLLVVSIAFVLSQRSIDARLRAAETIDEQRETCA